MSSAKQDWRTPADVVALVRAFFGGRISLDPCAPSDPDHFIAVRNVTLPNNGLDGDWTGTVYVNPPFDEMAWWTEKAAKEWRRGQCEILFLLPARTDTRYWHGHISTAAAVCFWAGRMKFVGAPSSAPFPTAIAYWGADLARFGWMFGERGMVVRLPTAGRPGSQKSPATGAAPMEGSTSPVPGAAPSLDRESA
jgi:hypothetical protein